MKVSLIVLALFLTTHLSEAQWVQSNGPYGGEVSCWAVKGDTVFGGTHDGIIISTDSGAHWVEKNNGMRSVSVLCVAVTGNTLFAGTWGYGIFRSSDNGDNWAQIGNALTHSDHMVNSICVIPPENGIGGPRIIIGNGWGGSFLSDDLGDSWVPADPVTKGQFARLFAVSGNTVIASTYAGLFRSTDRGARWVQYYPNEPHNLNCIVVRGSDIFAGDFRGVYRSKDNGATWTLTDSVTFSNMDISSIACVGSDLFVGTASEFLGHAGRGVYRSQDDGAHWVAMNTGIPSPMFPTEISVEALAVVGQELLAATDKGIFVTTNEGTWWTSSNSGFRNSSASVMIKSGDALLAGTHGQGVFRSTDEGESWTAVNYGMGEIDVNALGIAMPADRPIVFAGTNRGLFKSGDKGTNWTAIYNSTADPGILSLSVNRTSVMAGTSGGVILSSDGGTSWWSASSGLPSPANVLSLVEVGSCLFAGTSQNGIFRSTDQGSNWVAASHGLPDNTVSSIAVAGKKLFAAVGKIFVSADSGANWNLVESVPSDSYITSIVVMESRLFAVGSPGKVYMSPDAGTSWSAVEQGLPSGTLINSLYSDSTYFFAATEFEGVWRRPMSELAMTSVDRTLEKTIPSQTSLLQNYPNPFNPSTRIKFQVSSFARLPSPSNEGGQGFVSLKVFDVLGREVRTLVNKDLKAGSYETTFDARGLASGVYYYQLRAGSVVETKKLMLLR